MKNIIRAEIEEIINIDFNKKVDIPLNLDSNLFSQPYYLTPIELVYLIYRLECKLHFKFTKSFFLERKNICLRDIEAYIELILRFKS